MVRKQTITALAVVLGCATLASADDVARIFLSYKVVLNPANGNRPDDGNGNEITNAQIDESIDEMNALQETYFRGHRFARLATITEVGGQGQMNGPSQYYNTDFFGDNGSALKDQMQADAIANPNQYGWRNDAINIYMTNGICGGICSFPGGGDEIIIVGGCSSDNGPLQMHEVGHYFDLCHTQGCPCASCNPDGTGQCHTTPGNDSISDTLPDLQCWDQDDIANWSFGVNYDQLSLANQRRVDDSFMNSMSYHDDELRLTELQLDVWADISNTDRANVIDARTIFAEASPFLGSGTSTDPYNTLARAVNAAGNFRDDIIILRPGSFNESIIIDKQLTLRATRRGSVIIGANTAASSTTPLPFEFQLQELLKKSPRLLEKSPDTRLDFAGE